MKTLNTKSLLFIIIFYPFILDAQQYNSPGTVLKDTLFNRYLVSNYWGQNILQLSRTGTLSYFIDSLINPVGMVIVDSMLYAVDNKHFIKGFHLKDGKKLFQIKIPESLQLCGLTSDRDSLLFCTDIDANRLYQINFLDSSYKIIGKLDKGSDLEYDKVNNRLLIVTYTYYAGVYEYSFEKNKIDTLFLIRQGCGTCDGLEIDSYGNIFVSSWDKDAILYFDPLDDYSIHVLASRQNDPVYMLVDQKERNMVVPCMGDNKVNFIDLSEFYHEQDSLHRTTGINDLDILPGDFCLYQNYPNPFNPETVISYQLPVSGHVELKVYDILGREKTTLVDKEQNVGLYNVKFNGSNLSSGIYMYRLSAGSNGKAGEFSETRKLLLLR